MSSLYCPLLFTKIEDAELAQPGNPVFDEIIVNYGGRGNDTFDVLFTRNISNAGPAGILDGFTFRTSIDGSSWNEMDKTNMSAGIVDNSIQVTLGGTAKTISSTHRFDVAYDDTAGDIQNTNFPADDLTTFAATENTDNLSTVNFTRGQTTIGVPGNDGDHYGLTEASGDRAPVQNTSSSDYDMAVNNSNGTRTAPNGSDNAWDSNEPTTEGFLDSVDAWSDRDASDPQNNHSGGVWIIFDTLPASQNGGSGRDVYAISKWATTNNRMWVLNIWGRQDSGIDNLVQFTIQDENDATFFQRDTGNAVTTGTWFYIGWSFDSSGDADAGDTCALKMFRQDYNTPASFRTISNALGGTTTNLKMKRIANAIIGAIGGFVGLPADLPDAGMSHSFAAIGSTLSAAEHQAIAEKPRDWPYFVDLV